jgi:hypothetical protein
VSTGENRCFSKWPLNRDVGWVVVIERVPRASRCENWHTARSAPCHRISYSLSPALSFYKKHNGFDISSLNKRAWMPTPPIWGTHLVASRPQRAPGFYTSPLYGDQPTEGFNGQSTWLNVYLLPSGVGLLWGQECLSSVGSPWLSCSTWALLIKLKVNPLLCPSSLEVLMLLTILGLNTIVLCILSSKYHHLITHSKQFPQQRQKEQEQHNKKSTTKIMVPIIDNNDEFFCAVRLTFHSSSSTSFWTF